MEKRGQIQISFGMIFSIIIIIAIVAVSIYVITIFLDFNKCGKVVLFYEDLEEEIQKAWESPSYRNELGKANYDAATAFPMSRITGMYLEKFTEIRLA